MSFLVSLLLSSSSSSLQPNNNLRSIVRVYTILRGMHTILVEETLTHRVVTCYHTLYACI